VLVYEYHADAAIQVGDLGELQQCLAQLIQLYDFADSKLNSPAADSLDKKERKLYNRMLKHNEKYRAYAVVLESSTQRGKASLSGALSSDSLGNATSETSSGTQTARASGSSLQSTAGLSESKAKSLSPMDMAMTIRRALELGNYVHFFRCYRAAKPIMRKLLSLTFLESWRLRAMTLLFAAYRPTVPAEWAAHQLAFDADVALEIEIEHGTWEGDENEDDEGRASGEPIETKSGERKRGVDRDATEFKRAVFNRFSEFLSRFGIQLEPTPDLTAEIERVSEKDPKKKASKSEKSEIRLRLKRELEDKRTDLTNYVLNVRDNLAKFTAWQAEHNRAVEEAQMSILRPNANTPAPTHDSTNSSTGVHLGVVRKAVSGVDNAQSDMNTRSLQIVKRPMR